MKLVRHLASAALLLFAGCGMAQTNDAALTLVPIAGLAGGSPVQAYWLAANAAPAPAILALHGCGGMLGQDGLPNARTHSYAGLLHAQGWHVLFVDSLTPRGMRSVCGDSAETLPPARRVADVQAALAWLAQRADVDPHRIGILGWSHGGSVALLANAQGVEYVAAPRAVVAFYPGCGPLSVPHAWQPARPILMQLGQDDDWTDPTACRALVSRFPEQLAQDTYAGSGHGFDSDAPRRELVLRRGSSHERRVHIGGNASANALARQRIVTFFQQHFSATTP